MVSATSPSLSQRPRRIKSLTVHKLIEGTAVDALKKGLADVQQVCDVVADEFWTKREAFNAENGVER